MDNIDNYLRSPEFSEMVDTTLLEFATVAVERYFSDLRELPAEQGRPVKRNQVKGLQAVSQQQSTSQLKKMAQKQWDKAIKRLKDPKTDTSSDALFWRLVKDLIGNSTKDSFSLSKYATKTLESKNLLPESRKERSAATEKMFRSLSAVFFEHFCCHFYYLVNRPR